MTEFTVGKNTYRAGRMDAMKQLHISRRLAPFLCTLGGLGGKIKLTCGKDGEIIDVDGSLEDILIPLGNAIAAMSDEDVEYVFNTCLEVTELKQDGGTWAPLCVKGTMMFDGVSLPVRMQAVYHVVQENLTDFFGELPSLSSLEGFLKQKGLIG